MTKEYEFTLRYETDRQCFELMMALLSNGKPFDTLDNRERQILSCIYSGLDVPDICKELGIKEGHYNVKLTSLRKKGFINDSNKPRYQLVKPSSLLFTFTREALQNTTVGGE